MKTVISCSIPLTQWKKRLSNATSTENNSFLFGLFFPIPDHEKKTSLDTCTYQK